MKLYVKDIVRKPNDTLYTFLVKVLRLSGKGFLKCSIDSTYLDPEFKKLQCDKNKFRSFDEIVLISKTYFRVSDKSVAKVIKKILDNYYNSCLVLCDSANKWVLQYGLYKNDNIKYCANYNKSYMKTNKSGIGKYSFDDIITLMGLTKEDIKINE